MKKKTTGSAEGKPVWRTPFHVPGQLRTLLVLGSFCCPRPIMFNIYMQQPQLGGKNGTSTDFPAHLLFSTNSTYCAYSSLLGPSIEEHGRHPNFNFNFNAKPGSSIPSAYLRLF